MIRGVKLPFAWLFSWYFYVAGDLGYKILGIQDWKWWVEFWYPVYNENMLLSADIQEWVGEYGRWWPLNELKKSDV